MKAGGVSSVLIAGSIMLGLVAVHRWSAAIPNFTVRTPAVTALRAERAPLADDSLASAEDLTVTNDPFRLSNRAAITRYDPAVEGGMSVSGASAMSPLPRPTLSLKAIAGGPPWRALVDGLPGQLAGAVVSAGDRFERLVVRAVTRDSVIVQSPDTTWVLGFRKRP